MAAFDNNKQKRSKMHHLMMETGSKVTIAGVQDPLTQALTVATKLQKIISGFGFTDTDGLVCIVTPGLPSGGQVAFKRLGAIETNDDTISYTLFGFG